ncbi:MAG TPA: hypothetical protein VMU41_04400 [Candidatus Binataceae bacterium]|nr:hypothetical protein [Candidatus Binataceae bacterium]
MSERSEHNLSLMRRSVIVTLALLLLAAQSFSTAHYHQKDFRDNFTHAVQGSDALCSLCLFHFHAPAQAAAPPDIGRPVLAVSRLTPQAIARLHALAIALVFSRGPPSLQ